MPKNSHFHHFLALLNCMLFQSHTKPGCYVHQFDLCTTTWSVPIIIFLVYIFQHSYLLQRDSISPYSVRIRENTDQKNSETLFTHCTSLLKLFGLPLVLLGGQILQTLKRNTLVHHVSKYDISKAFHNFQTGWNIKNRIIGN